MEIYLDIFYYWCHNLTSLGNSFEHPHQHYRLNYGVFIGKNGDNQSACELNTLLISGVGKGVSDGVGVMR